MTSVVDKYYRKIIQNIDNVRMKFDISSLLVKSKEHDSKIDTNESNISGNKSLIDTNESNISGNKSLIDTNTNNISNNYNFIQINKKKSDNNTTFIDTNRDNISVNLSKINAIEQNNLEITDEVFNNSFDITNQSFKFNSSTHSYKLFEKVIENNMVNG